MMINIRGVNFMKFTNIENNLGNIILGALNVFMILSILFVLGLFGWVDLSLQVLHYTGQSDRLCRFSSTEKAGD